MYNIVIQNYKCEQILNTQEKFKGFKNEYFYYLFWVLASRMYITLEKNKIDCFGEDEIRDIWIPLSSVKLNKMVDRYKRYFDFMQEHNIINCDESFEDGKCKSYQMKLKFLECSDPHIMTLTHPTLIKKLASVKIKIKGRKRNNKNHTAIIKWIKAIKVDYPSALKEIMNKREYDGLNYVKLYSHLNALCKLHSEQKYIIFNDKLGRVYTSITSFPKYLRKYLSMDGEALAGFDLSGSHPLFFSLIIEHVNNIIHGITDKNILIKKFHDIPDSAYRLLLTDDISGRVKKADRNNYRDMDKFIRLARRGMLMDFIKDKLISIQNNLKVKSKNRRTALKRVEDNRTPFVSNNFLRTELTTKFVKTAFFKYMFVDRSDEQKWSVAIKYISKVMKQFFPNVERFLAMDQLKGNSEFSKKLHNIEAEIFINGICSDLAMLRPRIPFVGIHDCIYVRKSDVGQLQKVICDVFHRYALPMTMKAQMIPGFKKFYMNEKGKVSEEYTRDIIIKDIDSDGYIIPMAA